MLRDRNFVPLSHQHQHALALCVRMTRALRTTSTDLGAWRAEVAQIFTQEIQFHFAAEEQVLFPAARRFAELESLVGELINEHGQLRQYFARAAEGAMNAVELEEFAALLSSHIRKEERRLLEEMQRLLSEKELFTLGVGLDRVLRDAAQTCGIQRPLPR